MDFSNWFKEWLARHPLREPPNLDQAGYTAEVMARVSKQSLSRSPQKACGLDFLWMMWLRIVLGSVSVALLSVIVVLSVSSYTHARLAKEVVNDMQVLAELGESVTPTEPEMDEGIRDPQSEDALVLAESDKAVKTDDQWIEQTMQILDQLNEEDSKKGSVDGTPSEEDWINDMQMLDSNEFSSHS